MAALTLAGFIVLRDLRERLERAQVEATVRNLNSALQFEVAHRIAAGQEASISTLAGANPVPWLASPPPGYVGEVAEAPAQLLAGHWYFARSSGELLYRPRLCSHLVVAAAPPVLRWRIGPAQGARRLVLTGGLALVATVDYRWY